MWKQFHLQKYSCTNTSITESPNFASSIKKKRDILSSHVVFLPCYLPHSKDFSDHNFSHLCHRKKNGTRVSSVLLTIQKDKPLWTTLYSWWERLKGYVGETIFSSFLLSVANNTNRTDCRFPLNFNYSFIIVMFLLYIYTYIVIYSLVKLKEKSKHLLLLV